MRVKAATVARSAAVEADATEVDRAAPTGIHVC